MKIRFLTLVLLLMVSGSALAGGAGGVRARASLALDLVPLTAFPALDRTSLLAEDELAREEGEPERFAVAHKVALTPDNSGVWEVMEDGRHLWRLRLSCPEVLSLNLGFTEYRLPMSGSLQLFSADGYGPVFRFDSDDNRSSGELWTPVLLTDEMVVELLVAAEDRHKVVLTLGQVGCGYRFFGEDTSDKSGSCNIDVICSEGDDWRDEIAAIGVYSVNGSFQCSGVMVNNTAEDERPLFLTANHCPVTVVNAPSVVVYWNYESPGCGDHGGGTLDQFNSGTTLLAAYAGTDFMLLELDDNPDPVYGVTFAGWDRSGAVPNSAVCIHHPSTDEKSISFEDDPLTITSYLDDEGPGNSTHLRVEDWDLGTTEGGSSGSPLFDANHRIVGQLHGGYASCSNDLPDWYGRFSLSWDGGGAADNRLRDYLDPGNTGVMFLDLKDSEGPPPVVPDYLDLYLSSISPNPFLAQAEVSYRLNKTAAVRVRVLDISGRLVRDLGTVTGSQGENVIVWNGIDEIGRKAPSGLYLIYLESDGQTARGQVVFLH